MLQRYKYNMHVQHISPNSLGAPICGGFQLLGLRLWAVAAECGQIVSINTYVALSMQLRDPLQPEACTGLIGQLNSI